MPRASSVEIGKLQINPRALGLYVPDALGYGAGDMPGGVKEGLDFRVVLALFVDISGFMSGERGSQHLPEMECIVTGSQPANEIALPDARVDGRRLGLGVPI